MKKKDIQYIKATGLCLIYFTVAVWAFISCHYSFSYWLCRFLFERTSSLIHRRLWFNLEECPFNTYLWYVWWRLLTISHSVAGLTLVLGGLVHHVHTPPGQAMTLSSLLTWGIKQRGGLVVWKQWEFSEGPEEKVNECVCLSANRKLFQLQLHLRMYWMLLHAYSA